MEDIKKRINRRTYQNLNGFWTDVQLLVANCKQYNEDGSLLYQDAGIVEVSLCCVLCRGRLRYANGMIAPQDNTRTFLRTETANNPDLGRAAFSEYPDVKGSGNMTSTAPDSVLGGDSGISTPAPGNGNGNGNGAGGRLKLNLGGHASRIVRDEDDDDDADVGDDGDSDDD